MQKQRIPDVVDEGADEESPNSFNLSRSPSHFFVDVEVHIILIKEGN